jgi:hypothetical protein
MDQRVWVKAKYSFYSALVFFLFVNPETLRILHMVLGGFVPLLDGGALTVGGLAVTTALFFFTMWGLMLLPA